MVPEQDRTFSRFARQVGVAVAITAVVVIILVFLWEALHVLLLMFMAVLVAVMLDSATRLLQFIPKMPRWAALTITCLVLAGAAMVFGVLAGPSIAEQLTSLTQSIPDSLTTLQAKLQETRWGDEILSRTPMVREWVTPDDGAQVASFFGTTFGMLGDTVFAIFAGLYLAISPNQYKEGIVRLVPPAGRDRAREIFAALGHDLRRWLVGQLVAMVLIGVLFGVGLAFLGVPLALALGVIAGLFAFVPILGPIAALIPSVLIAFSVGPQMALYVILLYLGIQSLESYIITPVIQKQAVHLPPFLLLTAQMLMAVAAGLLGVLVATPLLAASIVLVRMVYVETILGDEVESQHDSEEEEEKEEAATSVADPLAQPLGE